MAKRLDKMEVYKGKDGWRIRTRSTNGQITLSGERYGSKWKAVNAAKNFVQRHGPRTWNLVILDVD